MLGFLGSHDFEEIHFCFIIFYFCEIRIFYFLFFLFLHLEELLAKEWGRWKFFFFFFWVFCIKILFLTNKFSIIYFVRVIFSCVDISFDKT